MIDIVGNGGVFHVWGGNLMLLLLLCYVLAVDKPLHVGNML